MIKQELEKAIEVLRNEFLNKKIQISVTLDGVSLFEGLDNKDIIGGIIQSCFSKILKNNQINIKDNIHTQEFPDFFIGDENDEELVELKSYNAEKSANFDISNFDSFCEKLKTEPKKRLNAKYIIMGYIFDPKDNSFKVTKMHVKKVHEICSKRDTKKEKQDQLNLPLKCQVKKRMIYNIRPLSSFDQDDNKKDSRLVKSPEELICLIGECKEINSKLHKHAFNKEEWITDVLNLFNQ